MRTYYPFLSEEFNDLTLEVYSHYVYLLGYDNQYQVTTHSGVYDIIEETMDIHSSRYVVLRNDYAPEGPPIPQYLDSIAAKLNLRRH